MIRVGIGFDSHKFVGGKPLILGGVHVPHTLGLKGHSDADAVAHAIMDAMLGALALGDIGRHFPDTDPAYKDADSMRLLAQVHEKIHAAGWMLQQADVTVITQVPKLAPHIPAMEDRLAKVLGVTANAMSIKAKTNEGMGFIGRGEGLAVMAVVTLVSR